MSDLGDARVALLERLFDHAPLFPPASLPLAEAVAEDERARASASAFALGRFVCPASRLRELPELGRGVSAVLDAPLPRSTRVEAVEAPPGLELESLTGLASDTYVEIPLDDDLDARVAEVEARGFGAKVRCSDGAGGVAEFLRACRTRGIAYKATAGLHHALRTEHEHGFLNLLAAAVFSDEAALEERDPDAFEVAPERFRWRGRTASAAEVAAARRARLRSIGTCSFFEPVEELERLAILPL